MDERSFKAGYNAAAREIRKAGATWVADDEAAWVQKLSEMGEDGTIRLMEIKPTEFDLQMRFVVKFQNKTLLSVLGIPRNRRAVTAADLKECVDAEQIIEKLVGVRVHLLQEVG